MPRIATGNMLIGFIFIFLSASAGLFLSTEHVRAHVNGGAELTSWWIQLSSSAHGHTNLFGMLHVLLGLTMPYSFGEDRPEFSKLLACFLGVLP